MKSADGGNYLIPDWDSVAQPVVRGAEFQGPMGKVSVRQLRRWSRTNPWIRAAINLRRQQVSSAVRGYAPVQAGASVNDASVAKVEALFRDPNPKHEGWRAFIEPVIEDLLVLDQGCIELEQTVGGRLGTGGVMPIRWLWYVDAGSIRFDPDWDGTDPARPRYFQYDDSGRLVASFLNSEMTVLIANPVTYSPLGLSPLEVLAATIEADLAAAEYNRRTVHDATPPGLLDLGEGIRPDQVDAFRAYWDAEVAGRSQVAIMGGGKNAKWTSLAPSNRDMQFMEWLIYLARQITAVFRCQPQDIGINFDVNRSTSETGMEATEDGLLPLADLVASRLTADIVSRIDPNLRLVFPELGKRSNAAMADYYKAAMPGVAWVRPNDALRERGYEGIGPLGDELWIPTGAQGGSVPMSVYLQMVGATAPSSSTTPPPAGAVGGGETAHPRGDVGQRDSTADGTAGTEDEGGAAKAAAPFDPLAFYRRPGR